MRLSRRSILSVVSRLAISYSASIPGNTRMTFYSMWHSVMKFFLCHKRREKFGQKLLISCNAPMPSTYGIASSVTSTTREFTAKSLRNRLSCRLRKSIPVPMPVLSIAMAIGSSITDVGQWESRSVWKTPALTGRGIKRRSFPTLSILSGYNRCPYLREPSIPSATISQPASITKKAQRCCGGLSMRSTARITSGCKW